MRLTALIVFVLAVAAPAAELVPIASTVLELRSGVEVEDRLVGRVVSARRSDLGFEGGGRVESIVVDAGDHVRAGDILAALDVRRLEAQRRETQARLAAARADLERVEAELELASATRRRQDDLYRRGVAAAQEHDEAVFGERALRAQIGSAQASIGATEAALASVEVALDLARLKAPFDGVITIRHVDEGTIVAGGAPVLSLMDDRREARVGIPVAKRAQLEIGARVAIEIEGRDRECTLRQIVDTIDPATRTVEAIFDLPTGSDAVDGAVARLALGTVLDQTGFWLPTTALTEGRRGLWSVFVLRPADGAHLVERRDVQLLYVRADRVFVRGAIEQGERVAIAGLERVVPGQRVLAVDD
jgi:RND family efflux transporter MFP subunit